MLNHVSNFMSNLVPKSDFALKMRDVLSVRKCLNGELLNGEYRVADSSNMLALMFSETDRNDA